MAAPRLDSAVRTGVRTRLESLKGAAERATGLTLSFDSISPSILNSISIRGLRVGGPGGSTLLEAGKVFVYYDVPKAARGGLAEALTAFRIEDAALSLDFERDRELLESLARLLSGGSGGSKLSVSISGRDVSIRASASGIGSASLAVREFEYAPKGEEADFSFSGDYVVEQRLADLGTLRGPLSVAGSIAADLSRARMELGISARARDFALRTQRFELLYSGERIELRKVRDEAPLDMELAIDLSDGSIAGELRMEGFSPASSLQSSGRLAWLAPWLAAPYSGSLSVDMPAGKGRRLSYAASISSASPGDPQERPVGASISAHGDLERLEVESASLRKGRNSVAYSGSFRFADLSPDGRLELSLSLREGQLPVEASVHVYGHEGEYSALAETVAAAGATFRDLAAVAALRGGQVDFRASFLLPETEEPAPELPPLGFSGEPLPGAGSEPLVRFEGSASLGKLPSADLSVSLESVDLGPLRGFLEAALGSEKLASGLSRLRLGGELFLSSDFERLSWTAPDVAVVSRSMPGSYALLSLAGNMDSVTLRKASIALGGYELSGQGRLDFLAGGGLGFETSFRLQDVPYTLRGSYQGGILSATGDYGLAISAAGEGEALRASLAAVELPVPLGGAHFLASVDAEGRFATPEDWGFSLASLSLAPTGEGLSTMPRIALSGDFRPSGGQIWDLLVEDRHSSVSGPATATYSIGDRPSCRLLGVLGSKSTAERYDIDLAYEAGSLAGAVSFRASPLARLGAQAVSGLVDGSVRLEGSLDDPALAFEARLEGAKYRDQPISASAKGAYRGGTISVSDSTAFYLGHRLSISKGSFSLRDAASSVALSYSGLLGGERISFAFEAEGSSLRRNGGSLSEHAREYSAEGRLSNLRFGEITSERLPFTASVGPSGARLEAGGSGELSAYYGFDGAFDLVARAPFPLRLSAKGRIRGNSIDAVAKGIELELPVLSFLVAPEDFKFVAGLASGELSARGLLADPEIAGSLQARDVTLAVPGWIADPIGPFDLPVLLEGRSLSARAPAVPVGKGRVDFAAKAGIDHWLPSGLRASARSLPGSLVRLDASITGILVDGEASFGLDMELRGDTVHLGGDIELAKATVLVSPEVWASGAEEGEPSKKRSAFIAVDFDVGLSRGVQVLFPSRDFPVVSGYADRSSALNIHYDQAANDLLLKGTVALRGGEVFYIQRNFFLRSARLVFNESIDRFDPRVTVLAELRDRNEAGPVLITLRADNEPITSFQPSLSSDPTMTEAQIAALLGQNLLGMESSDELDIRKAAISGAEFIPRFNVTKAFEARVREALGLDIFYLKTQVLQRWLIDLSEGSAEPSVGSAPSDPLAGYLDETSLYAGMYLGESIFVHGSARLSQDDSPLVPSSDLRLNLELGAEFDTPFGIVQWTMTPNSPESLFIKDQSISMSWKLAY